ncbi:VanZ family protein [Wielerella bovis]|uniref:VanZ family protein n=1 Tax=Wielerella bovis TaxID=2917790 RepID=UPI0020188A55|nr:VanZ family protein [Wielerella bovis]ULJ60011.1 VanZ family protein [Wielerella bovis]
MIPPRNKWLIFALIWFAAGIYALIFREGGTQQAPPFPHFDKFAHCLLFFAQTWLFAKAWLHENRRPAYMALFIFGLIYAISSEIAQHLLTQTRQGDWLDALANMLGVIIALHFAHLKYQLSGSLKK